MRTFIAVLGVGLLTEIAAIATPPLTESSVTNWQDLGTWDDAYVLDDLDIVVLRRGDAFSMLAVTNAFVASPLANTPAARDSMIVGATQCDGRIWLFLQRPKDDPCAVDLSDGRVVEFETTAMRAPWGRGPEIQSHIIIPHAKAAVFMIAGGSGRVWPRPGNRPIYFWLSLATGELVRVNTGWDLDYFDEKQLVAVFSEGRRGNNRAVDMQTGQTVSGVPDQFQTPFIPFDWQHTRLAQPIRAYCPFPPDPNLRESLIGVSVEGRVFPLGLAPVRAAYLATPRVRDGHLAFRLREEGRSEREASLLYVRKLNDVAEPMLVSTSATDCILLAGGDCIYTTARAEPRGQKDEAWFRVGDGAGTWDLLEGVARLPPLSKSLTQKDYVKDVMHITLSDAFGSDRRPNLALCRFAQSQCDMRSNVWPNDREEERLGIRGWQRTMVVGRDRRILLPVLRGIDEQDRPDILWLHCSGRLIAGYYQWAGGREHRQTIRLRTIEVE